MTLEQEPVVGTTTGVHRIDTYGAVAAAVTSLLEQTRRRIAVFAPALDGRLFNNSLIAELLARFAARHPRNRAQFLVIDTVTLLRDNPRLTEVCRRFSTFVQARAMGEEHAELTEMFMVVDGTAYLHQKHTDRMTFLVDYNAPAQARLLGQQFDNLWQQAQPISALNALGL